MSIEPEIVDETLVYDKWIRLVRASLRMPDGEVVERHYEDHGAAVAVLPYDPDRRCALLITQPRTPVVRAGEPPVLELVAGRIEGGSPEQTAIKEAMEEAGVAIAALEPVAMLWTLPSISTERLHLYLARYGAADRTGLGGGADDENEGITVVELPLAELAALVAAGGLPDTKTLVAVQTLMLRWPELFSPPPARSS